METGFAEMEDQSRRLTDQLAEKEASLAKVIAEQIKATHLHNSLKEERNALVEKVAKSDERYNIQTEMMKKLELKIKQQAEEIVKKREETNQSLSFFLFSSFTNKF
jgi:seryl-tRNA synthetase